VFWRAGRSLVFYSILRGVLYGCLCVVWLPVCYTSVDVASVVMMRDADLENSQVAQCAVSSAAVKGILVVDMFRKSSL
jgi:hypothetical protein